MHRPPTAEEVREHSRTHLPYRSWCPQCVGRLGISTQHRRKKPREDAVEVATVALEYCFLRNLAGEESVPILPFLILIHMPANIPIGLSSCIQAYLPTQPPTYRHDWPHAGQTSYLNTCMHACPPTCLYVYQPTNYAPAVLHGRLPISILALL